MRGWMLRAVAASALLLTAGAVQASAEIIHLTSGRTMSVRSHRIEGDSIRLVLRGGGEMICPLSYIRDIVPDEVPYPEPPVVEDAVAEGTLPAVPYAEIIDAASAQYGVDPRLVRAMIAVESGYKPAAVSRKGAIGLMQLMPATARQYQADPYDPKANIEAGVKHLRSLLNRFETSVALAAYNAGEAAVLRFGGIPPYRETRDYVSRILSLAPLR
jgi:soluble lytic murein transglycosylase-like protein